MNIKCYRGYALASIHVLFQHLFCDAMLWRLFLCFVLKLGLSKPWPQNADMHSVEILNVFCFNLKAKFHFKSHFVSSISIAKYNYESKIWEHMTEPLKPVDNETFFKLLTLLLLSGWYLMPKLYVLGARGTAIIALSLTTFQCICLQASRSLTDCSALRCIDVTREKFESTDLLV